MINHPSPLDDFIWSGRQAAYGGDYVRAIEIFTDGIDRFGPHPKLYRHRGHRLITLRRFQEALADFECAAELIANTPDQVEPDGIPNERNQPISSLHSNVWYHLGLVRYLLGDWRGALQAYESGAYANSNADRIVSVAFWQALAMRRVGESASNLLAGIDASADIVENHAYRDLLLAYRGELAESELLARSAEGIAFPTVGHGIGAWRVLEGREAEGIALLREVVEKGNSAAFGTIAAECVLRGL
jgi:tetratricopeptide (TPR) repeat protein